MPSKPAKGREATSVETFTPTATQAGMVINALRDPRRGLELEQLLVHFGGRADGERLRAAFSEAQERHGTLRSAFRWDGGTLVQEMHAAAPMGWSSLEAADAAALEAFLEEDRTRGFDATAPPLTRAAVVSLPDHDVLVWTFHHAILDGRSYRRVLEEVLGRYDGGGLEEPSKTTFADYARWLSTRDFRPSLTYFAKLLEGATTTPLPVRRTDPAARRHAETELRVADVEEALRGAERMQISIANLIQAAWAWTLARRARTDDVVFATTRSGRLPAFPEIDRVIGCLIDTLPLRVTVDEHASAETLLTHVRAQGLALRPHDHAPLTEILASAGVGLSSLVVVERYDLDAAMRAGGGANAERRFALRERSDFPLVLAAYQDGAGMRLVLEHDDAALPHEEAQLLLGHVARSFEALGAAVLRDDARPLASFDVLVAGEAERLHRWRRGPLVLAGQPASVTERFASTARARRDEVAVRDARGVELTYRELLERARRLAAALAASGAREGEVVLVLLPRSVHWVVTMWGVWQAEATYVPLDPSWPSARLTDVLDDLLASGAARTPVVVVDRATRELARQAMPRAARLEIDEAWDHPLPPTTSEAAVLESPSTTRAEPIAYLLYTSGTTGRPKGSRISHRALAAHAEGALTTYRLGPSDRALQFTSLGFDVSIEEVVPTLLAGGRVVLRSEESAHDLPAFLAEIGRAGVTVVNLPSAFFHELCLHLERGRRELPRSVRLVIVGGERPSPESYARFVAITRGSGRDRPVVRFVNGYGPTEVTITSVACDALEAGVPPDGRTEIPIGRPFGACRAYVVRVPDAPTRLRRSGERLPVAPPAALTPVLAATGEPGELWLAGPQVADGYLARPEATASAFVPDPFAEPGDPHPTVYRTGDLVRRDFDGNLVFLGRIDRQLKLRGHRIEPGEIEHALLSHEVVRDAVVVLAGEAESRALVAFVTSTGGDVDPGALRDALARTLPAIMVPSRVIVLAELPLSPTGKVDRDELAARAGSILRDVVDAHTADEPRDDVEAWLRPVFAAVLGKDDVELERSFFELGGHSLLAIRLLTRLREERPDLPVTLAMLFANPSVRGLAAALREAHPEEAPTLVRLNPVRADIEGATPLFCVCGVQLYGPLARAMEGDRPVYGAFLPIEADVVSGGATGPGLDVTSMARGYVQLVRRHSPRGPYLLAGVSFGGLLAYEMAQQLLASGEEVRLLALFDTILPRAIEETPWTARARGQLRKLRHGSDELLSAIRRRVKRLGSAIASTVGTPAGSEAPPPVEEIRDSVLKTAGEAYDRIVRPYPGRVVIIRARGGLGYEGEVVRWDMGWSGLVRPDTAVHGVPGDHLGILREPGVTEIASTLRTKLSQP